MTTATTGFRPASLRTKKEFCGYCNDPLPAKRRRSREYCSKSCCNRASEERSMVNGRTRPDGLPPFWPLGLEKDFALLGAVRGSVRSACDDLWSLLRRVDAEELEFRRSVETLRGRLLSQYAPHDLQASVEQRIAQVNEQYAKEFHRLRDEKESAERSSHNSSERSRHLEDELAQAKSESTRNEESWRKKEQELKQRLREMATERDAATKKCELLQMEHEHLKSMHHKLAESVATLQRKTPEKDEVIDVTEQLTVVGKRVKIIHDWVESKTDKADPQSKLQQPRLEQLAESVAQKLSQRLVLRVDASEQMAQFQRLQQAVVSVSQQVDWLIKQQPQPISPTVNLKPIQNALQLVYDQVRGMRAETNLSPVYSALNELAARMGRQQIDWSPILQHLQQIDHRIARLPTPSSAPKPRNHASEECVAALKKDNAALKRKLRKLAPLEEENEALHGQLGEAAQVIRFLKARQPVPGIELDAAGALMLDKLDLQDEIAQFQEALGMKVTEPYLSDRSPIGRKTSVAVALQTARMHLVRSPPPVFEDPARWNAEGTRLNRVGEDRLEEQLEDDLKRLRKLYARLHREYHES